MTGTDHVGASELLALSAALDRDDVRRNQHERPIYAIDSNVAIFLSQPSADAASEVSKGVQRVGLGTVLEGDPGDLVDIVAHALAEHLYVYLRKWAPLILIPPVANEVHRHVLRLAQHHVSPTEHQMKRWREMGAGLLKKLEHTKIFDAEVEHLISQMQELLFLQYGPAAALRRLRRVFAEKGILSSDIAAPLMGGDVALALNARPNTPATIALTLRANDWMKAGLNRGNPDAFSDAYVMARLEQANQTLEGKNSQHRIIYVTADRHLLETVGDQNPYLMLRHPRAWLTRLAIFQFGKESGRKPLLDLLRFKAQASDETNEAGLIAARTEWQDYLGRATESFVPLAQTRELFFDQAKDMLERYSSSIERYQDEITDLQDQAYELCFAVATETAASEAQRSESFYARTVPPLVFEQWPVTQKTIETFLSWHVPQDFDIEVFRDGLQAIDVEDASRYARYLALGTIFAGRGQWEQAASLVAKANSVVVPDGSEPGEANGREGAFFEAVVRRHLAKAENDLDGALVALSRADDIAKREADAHELSARRDEVLDIVPERFEAERLASDTSRFYFRRYNLDRTVLVDDREAAAALIRSFADLLKRLRGRLEAVPDDYSPASTRALKQLLSRTVTNIFGLALLSRTDNADVAIAWDEAERIGLTNQRFTDLSSIVAITILAHKRLAGRGKSSRDADLLRRHLIGYQRYYVFPYDRARFEEIGRLVASR